MTDQTYAMTRGTAVAYASNLTDLIENLMPGYAALSDDEATIARYVTAARTCAELQQLAAAQAADEGTFDPAADDEAHLTAIFAARFLEDDGRVVPNPLDLTSLGLPLSWQHPVHLFLVSTDYAPYTQVPAPAGNVAWIDPGDERKFLGSLSDAGVITFYVTGAEAVSAP